jgi:hypothetical protein
MRSAARVTRAATISPRCSKPARSPRPRRSSDYSPGTEPGRSALTWTSRCNHAATDDGRDHLRESG